MYLLKRVLIAIVGLFSLNANAGWPNDVTTFEVEKSKTVQVSGSFETGRVIDNLSWAWDAGIACFPGTQGAKYQGRHVFFATRIPERSIMNITVIPDDPRQNISIYVLEMGISSFHLPPSLPSVVSCEASHKWDYPKAGRTQNHTRSVKLNAIQNPYNVLIGVTGPANTAKGSFTVEVTTR